MTNSLHLSGLCVYGASEMVFWRFYRSDTANRDARENSACSIFNHTTRGRWIVHTEHEVLLDTQHNDRNPSPCKSERKQNQQLLVGLTICLQMGQLMAPSHVPYLQ